VELCVVKAIAPATTVIMPAAIKTTSMPFCIVLLVRFCPFFYLIMLHGSPVRLAIPRPTRLGDPRDAADAHPVARPVQHEGEDKEDPRVQRGRVRSAVADRGRRPV
jgi:hypothetical protein